MQPIDTNSEDTDAVAGPSPVEPQTLEAGRAEDLPHGSCKTVEMPGGNELALFSVNGEFYATENFCPHKGAPLSRGILCDYVIECDWHGWQFDVRTGKCLTVPEQIRTYEVVIDEGFVKIVI